MSANWTPTYAKIRQLAWERGIVLDETPACPENSENSGDFAANKTEDAPLLLVLDKLSGAGLVTAAEIPMIMERHERDIQQIMAVPAIDAPAETAPQSGKAQTNSETAPADRRISEATGVIELAIEGVRSLLSKDTLSDQEHWDALSFACKAADEARLYLNIQDQR